MIENLFSALAFLLAVAGLVFLAFTHHLFAAGPAPIAVQIGAVLLMLWARVTFGSRSFHATARTTEGGLVTSGPYRLWRHPIYASIVYFVWAGQVYAPTLPSLAAAAAITLALLARMWIEERFLRAAYPEYASYAKRAKRLIPFVV